MKKSNLLWLPLIVSILISTLASCGPISENTSEEPTSSSVTQKKKSSSSGMDESALQKSGLRPGTPQIKKLEREMHEAINAHRVSIGLKPFKYHSGLSNYARQHSRYLGDNPGKFAFFQKGISHQYFEYRAKAASDKYNFSLAENVIAGNHSFDVAAKNLCKGWLRSPGHKKNIEYGWSYAGTGAAVGKDGRIYFTQLFGSPNPTLGNINRAGYFGPRNW